MNNSVEAKRTIRSRDGSKIPRDVFVTDDQSNNPYPRKIINCYNRIGKIVEGQREAGHTIAVTIGTWDGIHEGQMRYILKAAQLADFLIVGVDSDRAVKLYKADDWRPVRNQDRRCELLTYLEFVNVVTLIDDVDDAGKWQYGLLDVVKPEWYIAVRNSYSDEQLAEIGQYCKNMVVLEPQGKGISTTQEIFEVVSKRLRKGFDLMMQNLEEGKI